MRPGAPPRLVLALLVCLSARSVPLGLALALAETIGRDEYTRIVDSAGTTTDVDWTAAAMVSVEAIETALDDDARVGAAARDGVDIAEEGSSSMTKCIGHQGTAEAPGTRSATSTTTTGTAMNENELRKTSMSTKM